MPKIVSVQYLRAIAALAVALFHTLKEVEYQTNAPMPYHGFLASGVDLFFAISGFIIWTTTWYGSMPVGRFVWNRLTRVVPMYWIFVLVTVAVSPFSHYLSQGVSLRAVICSLLFIPYTSWNDLPVLTVGWTLNYEMFFYGVFALLLLPCRGRWLYPALLGVFGVLVGLGLWLHPTLPVVKAYTNSLLLEFLFGVTIGKLMTGGKLPKNKIFSTACILAGCAALAVTVNDSVDLLKVWGALLRGVPYALILAGAVSLELSLPRFPRFSFFVLLGDASYATYLTHALVVMGAAKFLKMPWWPQTVAGFAVFACATMAALVVVGVAAHLYLEKPLLRLTKNSSIFARQTV